MLIECILLNSRPAAAEITAVFALKKNILPYQLANSEPIIKEKKLLELRRILDESGNPTAFPDTSIFNDNWEQWK